MTKCLNVSVSCLAQASWALVRAYSGVRRKKAKYQMAVPIAAARKRSTTKTSRPLLLRRFCMCFCHV